MDHIAIMKKEWGFIEKVLSGQKTIESRWYATKHRPWDIIKNGETIYFKNSGESVSLEAEVKKVMQFSGLDSGRVRDILAKYGKNIGVEERDAAEFFKKFRVKKYCILIFLKNPKRIKPFHINKKGFGTMTSFISMENISSIKI